MGIEGAAAAMDHRDRAAAERTGEGGGGVEGTGKDDGSSKGCATEGEDTERTGDLGEADSGGGKARARETVGAEDAAASDASVSRRTGTQSTPRPLIASRWAMVASSRRVYSEDIAARSSVRNPGPFAKRR